MATSDVRGTDPRENGKYKTESSELEEEPNLGIGVEWSSEGNDRAENGGSNYQIVQESTSERAGRRDVPRSMPPAKEFFDSLAAQNWAKQKSELDILRADKRDLQQKLEQAGNPDTELVKELSCEKQVRKKLETTVMERQKSLDECCLENTELKEQKEDLRKAVQDFRKVVGEGNEELSELSRTNDRLRREWKSLKHTKEAQETTIVELQAALRNFEEIEQRANNWEAKVAKLTNDEENIQDRIQLMARKQEISREIQQIPVAEPEDDGPFTSLEAEMSGHEIWDLVAVNARDQGEEEEYIPDHAVYGMERTQTLEQAAKVDKTLAGTQKTNSSDPESQEKPEESKFSPVITLRGDASGSGNGAKTVKLEAPTHGPQSPATLARESDLNRLERFLASSMLGKFVDGDSSTVIHAWSILDLSRRRRRPGLQGGSQSDSRPGEVVRFRTSAPETEEHSTPFPNQTRGKNNQTRVIGGRSRVDKSKSSAGRTIQYSSVTRWLLLLCFALLWWFSRSDKQLWMQANGITRQSVLAMRDESWAGPLWLARMSFDAENLLGVDKSKFG